MKGKIHCCKCGAPFPTRSWREAGVLACSVNGGRRHYACKPCSDAGFDLIKHAAGHSDRCLVQMEAA